MRVRVRVVLVLVLEGDVRDLMTVDGLAFFQPRAWSICNLASTKWPMDGGQSAAAYTLPYLFYMPHAQEQEEAGTHCTGNGCFLDLERLSKPGTANYITDDSLVTPTPYLTPNPDLLIQSCSLTHSCLLSDSDY